MTNPIFPSCVIPTELKLAEWRSRSCASHAAKFAEGGAERNAGELSLMQMCLGKISCGASCFERDEWQTIAYSGKQLLVDLLE